MYRQIQRLRWRFLLHMQEELVPKELRKILPQMLMRRKIIWKHLRTFELLRHYMHDSGCVMHKFKCNVNFAC